MRVKPINFNGRQNVIDIENPFSYNRALTRLG
jgi:hypothetical protein